MHLEIWNLLCNIIVKVIFNIRAIDWQSYQSLCDEPFFFGKFQDTSLWNPPDLRYIYVIPSKTCIDVTAIFKVGYSLH